MLLQQSGLWFDGAGEGRLVSSLSWRYILCLAGVVRCWQCGVVLGGCKYSRGEGGVSSMLMT
jgi:hypothetical protein